MKKLFDKLEEIRRVLQTDKVFDVIGEVFYGRNLSQMLVDAAANARDIDEILEDVEIHVDEVYISKVKENLGESLATRYIDYTQIKEMAEKAREYRLIPEYTRAFFIRGFSKAEGKFREKKDGFLSLDSIPYDIRSIAEVDNFKRRFVPDKPKDIPDNEELKLVIIPQRNYDLMKNILKTKGDSPRIYVNTIFFFYPSDTEKVSFIDSLKRMIAYEQIKKDRTLNLTHEQRDEIEEHLRKGSLTYDAIRKYYRMLGIPTQGSETIKEVDLGIPTYGENNGVVQEVYDKLRTENEIIEKISPLVIKERYLRERDYLKVQQIYDSMMKTPGEVRYVNRSSVEESLVEGVKQGLFGLGEIQAAGDGKERPICRFFKEGLSVVDPNYVIMTDRICEAQQIGAGQIQGTMSHSINDMEFGSSDRLGATILEPNQTGNESIESINTRQEINLSFDVPRGKVSQIMGVLNLLQQRFGSIHLEIKAHRGSISQDDYVNKIEETLRQLGIKID